MPIMRKPIPGGEPDEAGNLPHLVVGTKGSDDYVTLPGDDFVRMLAGDDKVRVEGTYLQGGTNVFLGRGDDEASADRPNIGLFGEDGDDILRLGAGDGESFALGGPGNDQLFSLGGVYNRLQGGAGRDTLSSSPNADHLWGGKGKDAYHLHPDGDDTLHFLERGTEPDWDVAYDFYADPSFGGWDKIDLSAIDADPRLQWNQAFKWIGQTTEDDLADVGEVGWFLKGEDVVVTWTPGGRQMLVLDGFADRIDTLGVDDFIL